MYINVFGKVGVNCQVMTAVVVMPPRHTVEGGGLRNYGNGEY